MASLLNKLNRKKFISFDSSPLPRVLTLLDLTALGIGSTIGVGFYILAGEVARNTAGPAVTISFLIAAVASVFAGLCYAEFGARVPKAGSAYIYSYVCVGEFVSFVIGWNLILEYVIGTASVARGYSAYVDELANKAMSEAFNKTMHMNVSALSPYPDFFAFGMTLLLAVILIIGVKESSRANNVFTGINIFVIVYVIIAGSTQGDVYNWHLSEEDVKNESICQVHKDPGDVDEDEWGTGGFAPYGFDGIMQGAATCFFGFVGFDIIATTGEEALRPERNIPLAISISLIVIFFAYFGMATVLTLALPYCMEDPDAPLIDLFDVKDMMVSKWIVSIGAIFGFSASLLGAMFPMPRIIYAMADDGLLFRFLSRINKRFKTPAIATAISGLLAATMALLFTLDSLVDMMSIGTLMAYTIVSVCVMLLRYTPDSETDFGNTDKKESKDLSDQGDSIQFSLKDYMGQLLNRERLKDPTPLSSSLVNYATLSFCFFCFLFALFLVLFGDELVDGDPGIIVLIVISFVITFANVLVIALQPASSKKLTFQVPLVPWIPALSTFINLYLMCNLSSATWERFVIWMVLGLLIYFLYGLKHSSGSDPPSEDGSSDGLEFFLINKNIPPIVIQPPTPWGSRTGTPSNTIRPPQPKRPSIIESPLVMGEVTAVAAAAATSERGSKEVTVGLQKSSPDEADSQSFDINNSPVTSGDDRSSSGSDNDEEDGINKLKMTKIVTEVTVYASHDSADSKSDSSKTTSETEETFDRRDTEEAALATSAIIESSNVPLRSFTDDRGTRKYEVVSVHGKSLASEAKPDSGERKEDETVAGFPVPQSEMESTQETSSSFRVLKSSQSAPIFGNHNSVPSVASSVPAAVRNADGTSNSEPGTPTPKPRHPSKFLVRASSFDNIPPSSLDSPFAKRVNKFVIIPVKVPSNDGGGASGPREGEGNSAAASMASDLNTKLREVEKRRERSLEGDSNSVEEDDEPDNPFVLLPLDTIRERGESKVSTADLKLENSSNVDSFGRMEEFLKREALVSA